MIYDVAIPVGPDDYRGGDGPLHVSRGKSHNPLYQAFIDAGVQAGYPFTEDMNGYQQEGFGWMDMTIHKGVRWNTANAYLRPALKRQNLRTDTKAMITRIVFENNRAVGVEYHYQSQLKRVRARKGVILTSGAINSPQLLNLSGIGNADDLKKLGIPVKAHLPGVGQNFQDHLEMYFHQVCASLQLSVTCKLSFRGGPKLNKGAIFSAVSYYYDQTPLETRRDNPLLLKANALLSKLTECSLDVCIPVYSMKGFD